MIKRVSVYVKGISEERYLAYYEPRKIRGEVEATLNLIV